MKQELEAFEAFMQKQGQAFEATAIVTIVIGVILGLIGYFAYDPNNSSRAFPPVMMGLGGMLILVAVVISIQSVFIKKRCRKLVKTLAENPAEVTRFWITEITTRNNGIDLNRRRELSVKMADGKTLTFPTAVVWSKLGGEIEDKTTPELLNALARLAPHAIPPVTNRWVVS